MRATPRPTCSSWPEYRAAATGVYPRVGDRVSRCTLQPPCVTGVVVELAAREGFAGALVDVGFPAPVWHPSGELVVVRGEPQGWRLDGEEVR